MPEIIYLILGIIAGATILYFLKPNPNNSNDNKVFLNLLESLRKELHDQNHRNRQEMKEELKTMNLVLQSSMTESQKTIQRQFSESSKIIQEVTQKLTKLDETNKQVVNFAEQMQSLENILKNPKHRGILGEYFLETLLSNILPPSQFKMQYSFSNAEIVDAAIYFRDKIIPVDAKFSLEKYNKIMQENDETRRTVLEKEFKLDIKNRIDETSKYIRPSENTTDFAFMFIPAEGIYYNLLIYKSGSIDVNTNDLIEYAFKKRVIIVSPTSFYAYLQTVLQGLKALEMENSVKEIIKRVEDLGRHLNSYQTYMDKLGNNLSTTVNMYNNAAKEFKKIDKDIIKISDGNVKIDSRLDLIDKPSTD